MNFPQFFKNSSKQFNPTTLAIFKLESTFRKDIFACGQRETLDIMNAFVNRLYDWNYTGIVNAEETDEENTDDEDFVRTSSNNNECDDVIILD